MFKKSKYERAKYFGTRELVLMFILGSIITATATYGVTINSVDAKYDNSNSTLKATNVQGALDELYVKSLNSGSSSKSCEKQCSNGFYATYTDGIMTSCRYSGTYGSAVCYGGTAGVNSLFYCQFPEVAPTMEYMYGGNQSAYYSQHYYPYLDLGCNSSLNHARIAGGGCPSTYTCS